MITVAAPTPPTTTAEPIPRHQHDEGEYGRFGKMKPHTVVHLGPVESRGGMSTVINNLTSNPPEKWVSKKLGTHSESGIAKKFLAFLSARRALSSMINKNEIDIAHFHVTHGISWWRKRILMMVCERNNIPIVIHIHSGRFDDYCSKFAGFSVRRTTRRGTCRTVVLEERWLDKLKKWIPDDSEVIHNFSDPLCERDGHLPGSTVSLLMLSRNSAIKGHAFAEQILQELKKMGIDSKLFMTGRATPVNASDRPANIEALGWVSLKRKIELISKADFLLLPSEFEGSSMSVIEAIVSGLPPIASTASEDTIGISSLVMPLDSPHSWAERISDLKQPEKYLEVVNLVSSQAKKYSSESVRSKWGNLYENLLFETKGE